MCVRALFSLFGVAFGISVVYASDSVSFQLTEASSHPLLKALFNVSTDREVRCAVRVQRPALDEGPAIQGAASDLLCRIKGTRRSYRLSFAGERADRWGARRETRSFTLQGSSATARLFQVLKAKGIESRNPAPFGTTWTNLLLCDAFGVICTEGYYLSDHPGLSDTLQVACHRQTTLQSASSFDRLPNEFDSYEKYVLAGIESQIQEGARKVDKIDCLFMAP